MINEDPFVAINKTWLSDMMEVHFSQSKGDSLSDVRNKISDPGKVAAVELGKGYRTPEGLRGVVVSKE